MRRQLGHLEAALGENAFYLVTVGLALGGFGEVEQTSIPAWDLDAFEAEPRGPAGDGLQAVERRRIARELRQEYRRPFDRPHRASSGEQKCEGGNRCLKQVLRYDYDIWRALACGRVIREHR